MAKDGGDLDYTKGRWPLCDDSPLPADLLSEYIAKHGEVRAQGYLDAVRDFQKHFQRCFEGFTNNYGTHIRPVGANSMMKKLYHRNSELLKQTITNSSDFDRLKL